MDRTVARQGSVPLIGAGSVSLFLNGSEILRPLFNDAVSSQERVLERFFKECVGNYSAVSTVMSAVHTPIATIQRLDGRSLFSLNDHAKVLLSDGSEKRIDTISSATRYPYKSFHERAQTIIESLQSTGYSPLLEGGSER